MDTLIIVRRIREAETLADKGNHGEAMRLLEPLLGEAALQDAHRTLIRKKLELFEKQRARVTRIMTRSASSQSNLAAISGMRRPAGDPNASSEMTAIRKPVDPSSERPTDVPVDKTPPGVPTEAVPKLQAKPSPLSGGNSAMLRKAQLSPSRPGNDTDYGQSESTEVQARPGTASPSAETTVRIPPPARVSQDSTVLMPAPVKPLKLDPNDSQELAPLTDDAMREEHTEDDPRSTSIFDAPVPTVVDQVIKPRPESAPNLARVSTPQEEHKTPPPSPRPAVSVDVIPSPPPVSVRDSIVVPHTQNVIPTPAPGPPGLKRDDDSTYLLADDHFAQKTPSRKAPQSTPDLRALVDRLPDDDLRRELALEVVRLREELDKSRRETAVAESPSRRQERARPESGTFHIPASQANTIVRRAAGSDRIEVHMPGRDEDMPDLQVLRRDSVRGKKTDTSTDRVALAQDYIEAGQGGRKNLLKPLATCLGALAVLVLIVWLVHLGWQSINAAAAPDNVMTEDGIGALELGIETDSPALAGASRDANRQVMQLADRGWLVQYAGVAGRDRVVGITVPLAGEDPGLALIQFGSLYLRLADGTSIEQVRKQLGEPDPPFNEELFQAQPEYSLQYKDKQGRSVLELRYRAADKAKAVAVRLFDAKTAPPFPELGAAK